MNEHENLKIICDDIGYDLYIGKFEGETGELFWIITNSKIDVREIIFTQEFMDKLGFYLVGTMKMDFKEQQQKQSAIIWHLNDPVDYVYNLIK